MHFRILKKCDRIVDHSTFTALYPSNLSGLLFGRHILVQHPDATFVGDGNRHIGFGDRVHSRGKNRHIQPDTGSQLA